MPGIFSAYNSYSHVERVVVLDRDELVLERGVDACGEAAVDVVHVLHPVEVKTGFTVGTDAIKHFSVLDSLMGYEVGEGAVICQTKEPYLITRDVQAVPVWAI